MHDMRETKRNESEAGLGDGTSTKESVTVSTRVKNTTVKDHSNSTDHCNSKDYNEINDYYNSKNTIAVKTTTGIKKTTQQRLLQE